MANSRAAAARPGVSALESSPRRRSSWASPGTGPTRASRSLAGTDLSGLLHRFDEGATVETGDLVPAADLLARVGPVPGLAQLLRRLGDDHGAETPGLAAAALEFAMEGLHLSKRLAKEELPGRTVYGG